MGKCKGAWNTGMHATREIHEVCHCGASQQHQVNWDKTRVLDRTARPIQLKVKEALHIQRTPANNRLNRDGGYELPGCWIATMGVGLAT